MAIIKCPECGKEISDKATSCPNCGFPLIKGQPKKEKTKRIYCRDKRFYVYSSNIRNNQSFL